MKKFATALCMLLGLLIGQAQLTRAQAQTGVKVLATIPPLAMLAERALPAHYQIETLLDGVVSPHEFALTPSMVHALGQADILIWVGPSSEHALDGKLETLAPKAKIIQLGRGEFHFWLSPTLAASAVHKIASAAGFRFEQQDIFAPLKDRLAAMVEGLQDVPFIVMHNAYSAFTDEFGLQPKAVIGVDHDVPLSARRIAQMRALLRQHPAMCVFVEPQFHAHEIAPIIEGSQARLVTLDPLGAGISEGTERYERFVLELVTAMTDCLKDTQAADQ